MFCFLTILTLLILCSDKFSIEIKGSNLTKTKATTPEPTSPYAKEQGPKKEIDAIDSHNVMVVQDTVKPPIQQDR